MITAAPTPETLGLHAAARRFHVTSRWLAAAAALGTVPAFQAGPSWIFNVEALGRALAKLAAGGMQGDVSAIVNRTGAPAPALANQISKGDQ